MTAMILIGLVVVVHRLLDVEHIEVVDPHTLDPDSMRPRSEGDISQALSQALVKENT